MKLPIFLSNPDFEVGIPVYLENLCFAAVIPKSRLQEKLNPNFDIINFLMNQINQPLNT